MSKKKSTSSKTRSPSKSPSAASASTKPGVAKPDATPRRHVPSQAAIRETIESVVIAFVLAFLFRTFEAEAFVIPTGSMAPTLMGRHKDFVCPECGYPFQVSASDEVYPNTNTVRDSRHRVRGCTCPICRCPISIDPKKDRSFKGDRILVGKFAYQFSDPERWDVAVFKYPGEAKTNFIKRIVGLPRETLRISHGDIFVQPEGRDHFTIVRKPPKKLLAMLQPVYDNDHVLPEIIELGWPARWQGDTSLGDGSPGGWNNLEDNDYRTFSIDGSTGSVDGSTGREAWLRYQHFVPSAYQWQHLVQGSMPPDSPERRLIADFCAYNTGRSEANGPQSLPLHWVGDLALQCTVDVQSQTGRIIFELIEGGMTFRCRIDVETGTAELAIEGVDDFKPKADTSIRGSGSHEIIFSNIDDELRLWVDGKAVQFDGPTTYGPLNNTRPYPVDLSPAGIASRGAACQISHLKLHRDIYYIAEWHRGRYGGPTGAITDFDNLHSIIQPLSPEGIARFLADPARWDAFDKMHHVDFPLAADQFLALGDNSARSKDSRLWEQEGFEYYVSRKLLIGKALYIYWPHSWDKLPGTSIPLPFFPNFARMGFVR